MRGGFLQPERLELADRLLEELERVETPLARRMACAMFLEVSHTTGVLEALVRTRGPLDERAAACEDILSGFDREVRRALSTLTSPQEEPEREEGDGADD